MNIELSLIRKDYNQLVKKGEKDLVFWGEDATPQVADYEVFFESTQGALEERMRQAILKPDPTRAYLDVGAEE